MAATRRALRCLLLAVAGTGCVASFKPPLARGTSMAAPPPVPLAESRTEQPSPAHFWVAGSWQWTGVEYVWAPGRWALPVGSQRWEAQ